MFRDLCKNNKDKNEIEYKDEKMKMTYFLPVARCSGLSAPSFRAEKANSHGAVDPEY